MININAVTCDDAWRQAAELVRKQGLAQESRTFRSTDVTTETLELLHAGMTIEDPRQRIVFSRPINPAFAIAEVIWILAGSNDLDFIAFWNPLMKKFSDDGILLHGAYGYRLSCDAEGEFGLYSDRNVRYFVPATLPFNQLKEAYNALHNTPHSRQVVLQVYQARTDFPVRDGTPRSKDIPCNLIADLKVRDGKLHWQQVMRSNDLFWGTPYNFIQWCSLQEIVAGWLGLEMGQYTHIASSLHVYQDHWAELRAMEFNDINGYELVEAEAIMPKVKLNGLPYNDADLRIESYDNWLPVFKLVLQAAVELTKATNVFEVESAVMKDDLYAIASINAAVAYQQWLCVLGAEVCRKIGAHDYALMWAERAGKYYQTSWLQWFNRKETGNG